MCIRVYLLVYEHLYITFTKLYVFIYVQFKTHICAYNYMYMISTYKTNIVCICTTQHVYKHVIFVFMNVYKISIGLYMYLWHIYMYTNFYVYKQSVYVQITNCLCAKAHVYKQWPHTSTKLHADCICVLSNYVYIHFIARIQTSAYMCMCARICTHREILNILCYRYFFFLVGLKTEIRSYRVYRKIKVTFIKVQGFQAWKKLMRKKPVGKYQDFRIHSEVEKLMRKKSVGKL